MANFDTSAWAKGQSKLINFYKDAEMRTIDPVLLKMVVKNTAIMLPNYQTLKVSEDRPIQGNFLTRTSRALGTSGRVHNHTGSQGVSATKDFTWVTYDDTVVSTLKEANNSIYSLEELQNNKLQNVSANFAEGLEKIVSDFILASRTGVNTATVEGTFDAVNDAFEITESTHGDRAIQISNSVMKLNKYGRFNYVVVCDTVAYNKFQYQANQGGGNSSNLSFQFQGVTFLHDIYLSASAAVIDATYVKGFWQIVPLGSVSALPWIPVQNMQGVITPVAMYGNLYDPLTELNLASHSYYTSIDGTSLGGNTQDVSLESEYSIDLGLNVNPLTTATASSIFAFALV